MITHGLFMIRSPLAKIRNNPPQQGQDSDKSPMIQKEQAPALKAVPPLAKMSGSAEANKNPLIASQTADNSRKNPDLASNEAVNEGGNDWSEATISAIKDLEKKSNSFKDVKNLPLPVHATVDDSWILRVKKFLKGATFVATILGMIILSKSDWFQENVLLRIQFFLMNEGIPGGGVKKNKAAAEATSAPQKTEKENAKATGDRSVTFANPDQLQARILNSLPVNRMPDCSKNLDLYFDGNKALTVAHYAAVGECLILAHDFVGAAKIYEKFSDVLRLIPEIKFRSKNDFEIHTELFYGYLISHIFLGDLRQASEMVRGRCPEWVFSHSCVGKIMVYAFQKVPLDPDGQKLFETLGALPPAAQSRLLLAGAMLATQEGRTRVADQRIKSGLEKIPKRAQYLRRMFYDFWSSELFHRGMFILLKNFSAQSLKSLPIALHGGLVKLRFLRESSHDLTNKKILSGYLSSLETRIEVIKDSDFLDILGVQALRLQMYDQWEKFLASTKTEFLKIPMGHQQSSEFSRSATLWFARSYLARGQYLLAIKALSDSRESLQSDPVASHLRGVAYFLMSEQSTVHLNAIAELTKAFKLKRSWETLVVLGFALTKNGKKETLVSVIKDLNSMVSTSGQKYWVELLKGDFYLSQGKLINAQKIAQDLLFSDPTLVLPRLLLIRALSRMGKIEEVKKEQSKLEEATRKVQYAGSFEALASPFGPLSLGKRPID